MACSAAAENAIIVRGTHRTDDWDMRIMINEKQPDHQRCGAVQPLNDRAHCTTNSTVTSLQRERGRADERGAASPQKNPQETHALAFMECFPMQFL